MSIKIYSYYIDDHLFPYGQRLDYKGIADFVMKNNIIEFLTDIPVYSALDEYGIQVGSINTPNRNEYLNYVKKSFS